jgi:hypothetical protein
LHPESQWRLVIKGKSLQLPKISPSILLVCVYVLHLYLFVLGICTPIFAWWTLCRCINCGECPWWRSHTQLHLVSFSPTSLVCVYMRRQSPVYYSHVFAWYFLTVLVKFLSTSSYFVTTLKRTSRFNIISVACNKYYECFFEF